MDSTNQTDLKQYAKLYEEGFTQNPAFWNTKTLLKYIEASDISQIKDSIEQTQFNGNFFLKMDKEDLQQDFKIKDEKLITKIMNVIEQLKRYSVYLQMQKQKEQNQKKQVAESYGNFDQDDFLKSNMPLDQTDQITKTEYDITQEIAHSMEIKVMNVPDEEDRDERTQTFPNRSQHERQMFGNVARSVAFEQRRLPYDPFDFTKNFNLQDGLAGFDYIMDQVRLLDNNFMGSNLSQASQLERDEIYLDPLSLRSKKLLKQSFKLVGWSEGGSNKQFTLGKFPSSTIQLSDEAISRRHAVINFREGRFYLQDVGSKSGTFLRIKNRADILKPLRIFECGTNELMIEKINYSSKSANILCKVIEGQDEMKNKILSLDVKENTPFIIGSNPDCQLRIKEDKEISENHAKLDYRQGIVTIYDLGSENGTWIRLSQSKKESEEFLLDHGSEIKINPYAFQVRLSNKDQTEKPSDKCWICRKSPQNVVLIPCSHNITCEICTATLTECPMCKNNIVDTQKIYLS